MSMNPNRVPAGDPTSKGGQFAPKKGSDPGQMDLGFEVNAIDDLDAFHPADDYANVVVEKFREDPDAVRNEYQRNFETEGEVKRLARQEWDEVVGGHEPSDLVYQSDYDEAYPEDEPTKAAREAAESVSGTKYYHDDGSVSVVTPDLDADSPRETDETFASLIEMNPRNVPVDGMNATLANALEEVSGYPDDAEGPWAKPKSDEEYERDIEAYVKERDPSVVHVGHYHGMWAVVNSDRLKEAGFDPDDREKAALIAEGSQPLKTKLT